MKKYNSNGKEYNNYMKLGFLFNGIFLMANICPFVPEFIKGMLAAIGFTLIIIGILMENDKLEDLRNYKSALLSRVFFK